MKRPKTFSDDLPHTWATNPVLASQRGLREDVDQLMREFRDLNPCASSEQLAAARAQFARELA